MKRNILIEDGLLSLIQYTTEDDLDWHHCWSDIDTQKGYNVKLDNGAFPPSSTQEIAKYPLWATIFDKANKLPIGVVRLSPPPYDNCDLAIWIYKPYRNAGYGTRAFTLGIKYCFDNLGLEKVGAGCYENNEASQKMLKKIGFIRDEQHDNYEVDVFTGEEIVQQAFVITKDSFASLPHASQ